ncbi:MAG: DUF1697 domain-containing protein [Gemmatimonadetes bacterium]|nr:DUF1697 domain-containing protein [Gemmatimonadota bacterium]
MTTCIALLRGINVGGRNRIPMAGLREVSTDLGWADVRTYIQSGNVIFGAAEAPSRLEADLERAILLNFGLKIAVLIRTAGEWADCVAGNPFPDESAAEPNRVMLGLAKNPPKPGAADRLQERASSGERVIAAGDALWAHFPAGAGTSKITPALLDRLAGSPVTMRNWRTVLKLDELARG